VKLLVIGLGQENTIKTWNNLGCLLVSKYIEKKRKKGRNRKDKVCHVERPMFKSEKM
jgi:hypothetical protein